jgi:galactose mutarotase-like enzyme
MSVAPILHMDNGNVSVRIATHGAELRSLQHAGQEYIWQGDPQWWSYSAPLLFPVIGRLPDGQINHLGKTLRLPAHGFARELAFAVEDAGPAHAELILPASPETLAMYPFEFELRVRFALLDNGLVQQVRIANCGSEPMPASFGFHPAFCWPVRQSGRNAHRVQFTHPESVEAYRIDKNGHLVPRELQLDIHGHSLALDDALFADGAVVLNPVVSTGLEYQDQDGRLLTLSWSGCAQLGLWTIPGAPFVCFEPWCGHPSPSGFAGELSEKPGGFLLQSRQSKILDLAVHF